MKTIDEIKQLMAADETAKADEALKELLTAEPNNLAAKMLYGTCRQLLGDEETFKRIHNELAPVIKSMPDGDLSATESKLWEKFHQEWMEATNPPVELKTRFASMEELDRIRSCQCLYGCPSYYRRRRMCCLIIVAGMVLLVWLAWWLRQKM